MSGDGARERLRQQCLLRALRGGGVGALQGWAHVPKGGRHDLERGFLAYHANAAVSADRALAARYPTVKALLGDESFAVLARHLWQVEPPVHGDLARWGHDLPGFITASTQLASEPYLADVARLDAAVHDAELAADRTGDLAALALLAEADPAATSLSLAAGTAVLASPHPIVSIWVAHHDPERAGRADRFDEVRAAFARAADRPDARSPCERAWVWREGWQVRVRAIDAAGATFLGALLAGASLAAALACAGPSFDFEAWLFTALREGSLIGAMAVPGRANPGA